MEQTKRSNDVQPKSKWTEFARNASNYNTLRRIDNRPSNHSFQLMVLDWARAIIQLMNDSLFNTQRELVIAPIYMQKLPLCCEPIWILCCAVFFVRFCFFVCFFFQAKVVTLCKTSSKIEINGDCVRLFFLLSSFLCVMNWIRRFIGQMQRDSWYKTKHNTHTWKNSQFFFWLKMRVAHESNVDLK